MSNRPGPDRIIALSADLESSRRVEDREGLAARIEAVLAGLNHRHRADLLAPLETTRGLDEISAVLARRRPAFELVVGLNLALWPHRFRFALADGYLDVVGERASDMDGPAFHRAADALARARKHALPLTLDFERSPAAGARLAEAAARMHHLMMGQWTEKIAEVVRALHPLTRTEEVSQGVVGARLGKTQQAVSDLVRKAQLDALLSTEAALADWFEGQDGR